MTILILGTFIWTAHILRSFSLQIWWLEIESKSTDSCTNTTVIKNYGECCCRVRSNGKAGIFNTGSGASNLSNNVWQFQLVQCCQSVVSYGWEKVCFKVCRKSWIANSALTWNFVSNCKKGAKETHEMLKLVYGDAAVTMKMVYKWFEWFCNGCELVEDEERSGRPSTSKTQENVERVSEMIRSNRWLTIGLKIWS